MTIIDFNRRTSASWGEDDVYAGFGPSVELVAVVHVGRGTCQFSVRFFPGNRRATFCHETRLSRGPVFVAAGKSMTVIEFLRDRYMSLEGVKRWKKIFCEHFLKTCC